MVPAILLTLGGFMAGALAMWPMFGHASAKISAAVLGLSLAAYLWVHAGARDYRRLTAVVAAAIVGEMVIAFVGIAGLMLTWLLSNGTPTPFVATAAAGAAGAAVVAVVFLLVLPSTGDHLHLEVIFCAAAGALSVLLWGFGGRFAARALAGPIVASCRYWRVAVARARWPDRGVVGFVGGDEPSALRYLYGRRSGGSLRLAHGQRYNCARRGTAGPRRRRVLTVCRRLSRGEDQVR